MCFERHRKIAVYTILSVLLWFVAASPLFAAHYDKQAVLDELQALKQRMAQLEQILLSDGASMPQPSVALVPAVPVEPSATRNEAAVAGEKEPVTTATVVGNVLEAVKRHGPQLNGALRFGYTFDDYNEQNKEKGGDASFNLFRLGAKGSYGKLSYNARYRWYRDYDFIEFGYIDYQVTDNTEAQLGISLVPFGLLPEAANNFWLGIPYFTGYGTDYDFGLKLLHQNGPWDLQLAFYKNDEMGRSSKLERFSYDLVTTDADNARNEETNQVNARLAYTLDHGSVGKTELGISGQYGGLYNTVTEKMGDHWAGAVHLDGSYGPFGLKLEVIEYANNPENAAGVSDDTIVVGAFGDAFEIAAEGTIVVADLSYALDVDWGPISNLKFYNDYSRLIKKASRFEDSQMNTLGCMITAGDVYTYIDFIMGNNAQYIGGRNMPFAAGEEDAEWQTKLNINVGYYF